MSARYFIENGETISPTMSFDWDGALVAFMFYDGAGLPVAVSGMPQVFQSLYPIGDVWKPVYPFATGEWRFNGPASRVRISLTGVTGYVTYRVLVWRTNDPMPLIPDGSYTGLRALVTQPYTEANVKNGLQFYLRAVYPKASPIPAGETRKIWVSVGDSPLIIKLRIVEFDAEELRLDIYSGPTGVTGGTTITPRNYNRVSPQPGLITARKGVTTTSDGTPFDPDDPEYFFGASNSPQRNPGSLPQGRERILPANVAFIVAFTNTGTGNARVQYFLDFYQGGTDLPIRPQ